jgi:hypothetical protein
MNNLKKYIGLISTISFIFSACASKNKVDSGEYRYVSMEKIPRGKTGELIGKAF